MWAFPFSPRWLADHGRMDEAIRVLADIHGNGDPDHPRVQLVRSMNMNDDSFFIQSCFLSMNTGDQRD